MSDKFLLQHLPGQLHGDIRSSAITTVSGGPTLLEPASGPLSDRKSFLVYNGASKTIYVGGSDVSTANGIPVAAGGSFSEMLGRSQVYATVSGVDVTGGQIRILEIA